MSLVDLQDWLISDGVGVEVERLSWLTVVTEIDNLVRGSEFYAGQETIDWERLLLAGSILARSVERRHQEAALRIATAAVTLETTRRIRDGGAILLGQLSNHRAISLAEGRNRVAAQLDSRLGLSMRLEAQRRKITPALCEHVGSLGCQVRSGSDRTCCQWQR